MPDPLPEYTDHRLRTEPDPAKQAAMIEARMADLRSRKPFTEEQFASERAHMERLAANGQKETVRNREVSRRWQAERDQELQRSALPALDELRRQSIEDKGLGGPRLFNIDEAVGPINLREVGVDGYVDLIALVEAILKAAEDGEEP